MSTFPYGTDYSCIPDLDGTFSLVSDPETVILQSVYKKLTTAPGVLDEPTRLYRGQFWDSATLDLREYLGVNVTGLEISNLYHSILSIFSTEQRYTVDIISMNYTQSSLSIELGISANANVPSMRLVFSVTSSIVSVERIQ
jgi:hypothetical protein